MLNEKKSLLARWFLLFLIFCFIGWIYEVGVYWIELGDGFINRGYLFGPWIPIYGIGGLMIVASVVNIKDKKIKIFGVPVTPLVCFVIAALVASLAELIASYVMELMMGEWLWDYTQDGPNFQGRIALKSSLRFGLMGLFGLYIVHNYLAKFTDFAERKGPKVYYAVVAVLAVLFVADVVARIFVGSNYSGPIG